MAVAFLLTWLLEERPLRATVATSGLREAFATPHDSDSVREITRELSLLVGREGAVEFLRRVTARAGLDLPPEGSWLLVRAAADGQVDVRALAAAHGVEVDRLRSACRDLHGQDLLTGGPDGATGLTAGGAGAVDALAGARLAALEDLAAEWSPAEHPELARELDRLAEDLAGQAPGPAPR
jgi:hypothetical protein